MSLIERGHLDGLSLRVIRRVASAIEARTDMVIWLPHGELDRLLNAGHAALHEALASYLSALPGWIHAPEVSFAIFRERGVIDILAFHEPTRSLLVIELKTEIVSVEDLLTTMDIRVRLASRIAAQHGWHAKSVSAWVVVADTDLNRRRVAEFRHVLRSAFPSDGRTARSWLANPNGAIRALSFWANSKQGRLSAVPAVRRRVRKRGSPVQSPVSARHSAVS